MIYAFYDFLRNQLIQLVNIIFVCNFKEIKTATKENILFHSEVEPRLQY